jgi:hypothetical protein
MMTCCKNCGVELDMTMNFCPLCGEPVTGDVSSRKEYRKSQRIRQEDRLYSEYNELTQAQRRKIFWEVSAIVLASGIMVSVIINLVLNKEITWSRYPIVIGTLLFMETTFAIFWQKRFLLLLSGSFASASVLVVLLELFNRNISWSITLGVPLLFAAHIIAAGLTGIIKLSRQYGLNVVSYALFAAGLLTVCIEGIISLNATNRLSLHWSIIVCACIIPVSAILLFIHYRLKRVTDLRKFFHI